MNPWLVIPVKSLRNGKSRLASALGPAQRRAFMDELLIHTLAQAAAFPGLERTMVVSACAESRARATALGVHALDENGCGLNAAVKHAQSNVRQRGATQILVVPCDLPFLRTEDLRYLSQLATPNVVVVAPDRKSHGTNGLCFKATLNFGFEFGPGSFGRHTDNAQRLQHDPAIAMRPGLAFDVDTADDLAQFYAQAGRQQVSDTASAR